jgi:hypothetical protein
MKHGYNPAIRHDEAQVDDTKTTRETISQTADCDPKFYLLRKNIFIYQKIKL